MRLYVTYGCGSDQRDCYSVVEGKDVIECMDEIQRVCGRDYAFTYNEEEFAGQVERYGYHEIPLHAQTMLM